MLGAASARVDRAVLGVLLGAALIVPLLNLLPAASTLHLPTWVVSLLGKYLCLAMLALSLDLLWGYCGLLSLGHGAFFALGAYAMGMYLMRQIGDRGVYGNPELPDFMVFLDWDRLPWYWLGFDYFPFALLMALLAPAVLATVFGLLAFRSRVTGVYFSIITQALTYALMLAFFRNETGFGGNNGLTDFKDLLGLDLAADSTRSALFALSALLLAVAYALCRRLVNSSFGQLLLAIRDAEDRVRFLGYRVEHFKLAAFVFSSMLAGLAGALYVPQVGIINPTEFQPLNSIEAAIWVAVGGRGTLVGPLIGALGVNLAKTGFTAWLPASWLFLFGAAFVAATLFLPRGIAGMLGGSSVQTPVTQRRRFQLPWRRKQRIGAGAEE